MQDSKHSCTEIFQSQTCTVETQKIKKGWKDRRLLLDLANLPNPVGSARLQRLLKDYPEVFGFIAHDTDGFLELLDILARFLRLAWEARNHRERSWFLFTVRQEYVRGMLGTFAVLRRDGTGGRDAARKLIPLTPPRTAFDLAIHNVQAHFADRMTVCRRAKDCDAPYFFRRRKGQKYCGTDCRAIVLKQRSDSWWSKHGKAWRAVRKKLKKRPALLMANTRRAY